MTAACSIEGCDRPVKSRGWCAAHYKRWREYGDPLAPHKRAPVWTPEGDALLLGAGLTPHTERWRGDGRLAAVAAKTGRTEQACRSRLNRILRDRGHRGGQWTDEGLWSADEDDAMRAHLWQKPVPPGTWPAVAHDLGRTLGAVRTHAANLRRGSEHPE